MLPAIFASALALAARYPARLIVFDRDVLLATVGFTTIVVFAFLKQDLQVRRQWQAVRHSQGCSIRWANSVARPQQEDTRPLRSTTRPVDSRKTMPMDEDFLTPDCPGHPGFGPSEVYAEVSMRQVVTIRHLVPLPEVAILLTVWSSGGCRIPFSRRTSTRTAQCEESGR